MNYRVLTVSVLVSAFALWPVNQDALAKKKKPRAKTASAKYKVKSVTHKAHVKPGLVQLAGREKRDFVPFERKTKGKVTFDGSAGKDTAPCKNDGKKCDAKGKKHSISSGEYYDQLDELEGGLNEQGLSISDEKADQNLGGVVYDGAKFANNEKTAASFKGSETTPPKDAKKQIEHLIKPPNDLFYGDKDNMAVGLKAYLKFIAKGDEIKMEALAGIFAWIYKKEHAILALTGTIWGNQSKKNASTNIKIEAHVLTIPIDILTSKCPNKGKATHSGLIVDALKKKNVPPPKCVKGEIVLAKIEQIFVSTDVTASAQIQAGPVPINVAVGIQIEIGIRFGATVRALLVRVEVEPYAKLDAFVSVGVGIQILKIGVTVELTVLDLSFPIEVEVGLKVDNTGPYVYLMWGADWKVNLLAGKVILGIELNIPGQKRRNFGFTIANWPGIQQRGSIFPAKTLKLYLKGVNAPKWPRGDVPESSIKVGGKGNIKTTGFTGNPWKRRAFGCLLADGKYMFADADKKTVSTTKQCKEAEKFEIQSIGLIGKGSHLNDGRKVRIKTYRRRWLKPNKRGDAVKQANLILPTHDTTFTMIVRKKAPLAKDVKVGFKCWGKSGYLAPSGNGFRCQKKNKWFKAVNFKKGKLRVQQKVITDCVPKQIHCGGPWSTQSKKSYNKCLDNLKGQPVCDDYRKDAKKCAAKCAAKGPAGVACRLKCNFAKPINCKAKKFECGAPHNTVTAKSYNGCLNRLKGIKACKSYVAKAQKCAKSCAKGITGPKCRLDCNYGKEKNSCKAEQFDCGAPHNTITAKTYDRCLSKLKALKPCKSYVASAQKCAKKCKGPGGPFCRLDCNFGKNKKKGKKNKGATSCKTQPVDCGAPHNNSSTKKYNKCLNKYKKVKVCKNWIDKARQCAKSCKTNLSGAACRLDCNFGRKKKKAGKQKAGKQKAGKQKAGKQKAGKQKAGKKWDCGKAIGKCKKLPGWGPTRNCLKKVEKTAKKKKAKCRTAANIKSCNNSKKCKRKDPIGKDLCRWKCLKRKKKW